MFPRSNRPKALCPGQADWNLSRTRPEKRRRRARSRRAAPLIAALAFLLLGHATPALSFEEGDALAELSLEELMNVELVVSASRYEQDAAEAPASVTIVTAQEIQRYGYQTLADVLRSVRGFYTSYDRTYHYVGSRGFGRPGDYNTRLLLLVNGHRINDNIYESAYIGTGFSLDLDLVERIEVVRGPSSSVYGTNAFFGVVNVITKEGSGLGGLWLTGEGGSYSSYGGSVDYGVRTPEGVDLLISGSAYESDGQDLFYQEFDTPEENNGITSGTDYDKHQRFFTTLRYEGFTLHGSYSSREKGIPTAAWETLFNDPGTMCVDTRGFVALSHRKEYGEKTGLESRFSYDWYSYEGDYVYDYGEEEPDIVVFRDESMWRWLTGEVQLTRRIGERNTLVAGGDYRHNQSQDQKSYDPYDVYLDDVRSGNAWAAYLQDELSIGSKLLLNAGVRHDQYDTFGGTTNPRVGLIVGATPATTIKFLYGTAFRAPNAYELYYTDGEETGTQKANTDLMPEEITTYEVAVEQHIGKRLHGTVSLFTYRVTDLITMTTDLEDDLLVYRNMDKAEARGVETELFGAFLRDRVRGRLSYTYQDAEDVTTGQTLANSPFHLAKMNFSFPLGIQDAYAGAELQYTGERRTLQGEKAAGYLLANLTITAPLWQKKAFLSASLYNAFDTKYSDPVSDEYIQDAIDQDGRSLWVRLRYRI